MTIFLSSSEMNCGFPWAYRLLTKQDIFCGRCLLFALLAACSEHCTAMCILPLARVRGAASLAAHSNILSAQATENPGFESVLNSGRVNKLRAGHWNIK